MKNKLHISRVSELNLVTDNRQKFNEVELHMAFFSDISNKKWSSKINQQYTRCGNKTAKTFGVIAIVLGFILVSITWISSIIPFSKNYYLYWIASVIIFFGLGKIIGKSIAKIKLEHIISKIRYHSNNQKSIIKN